jgi:acyl-coenzyme A synthetase/AMP-(fatty) acid ligase/acyl carrier protein
MQSKNMINLFEHQKTEISQNDKSSFLSNTSFDVSFQEIFSTLLTVGTLYPVSDTIKKDVVQLSDFLKVNKIETLFLPTAYFKILIESNYFIENISSNLKNIVVAGEKLVLNETILSKLRKSDLRIHNHYGPAETHVVTTLIIDKDYASDLVPSIGKPISNTQIYILDEFMNPVGIGIEGKILIGGKNVSKGYWNKEDLTNQKFISNPYSEGKLYDTGDLGCWLADGNIQYIGRNDQQIKIRGFRVELEEIESVLNSLIADFNQVLVTSYTNETETQLVAYYTSSKEVDVFEIKKMLNSKIPNYMIPTFFMKLESIPLTPNGKIDKRALPVPKADTYREKEVEQSRTETEQKLVAVWQEILSVSDISIYDNFFDLGGHSLHITRMIYKINEIFAIKITIEEVFNLQNIQALGKLIDQEVLLKHAMNNQATDKLEEIWEI